MAKTADAALRKLAERIEKVLPSVKDQKSFVNTLLFETLGWGGGELPEVEDLHEITYHWSDTDLRARGLDAKLLAGRVLQLQLATGQPWGIFILEFKEPSAFTAERGMTGVLRQVVRGLVHNRNKPSGLPSWKRENLLFICTHAYQHFRIAHFKAPAGEGKAARLAAFGWGPDMPARTAIEFNLPNLAWPSHPSNAEAWTQQWSTAFDVEKVTRRFFEDYKTVDKALRVAVAAAAGEAVKGKEGVQPEDAEPVRLFVQTLLNRLMFLRFIERKG